MEAMLIYFEIHASALESNALRLQQEPLLETVFAGQGNASPGAKDALPRQARHLIQHLRYVARRPRITGGFSDRAVGADFSARNFTNCGGYSQGKRRFVGRLLGHGSR